MITIGQITKPQGVRGEVKVRPLTDDPSRFCVLKTVTIANRVYRIEHARCGEAEVFLKLVGVDDRNTAETLRGAFVEIDRSVAIVPSDGEFFIADLIGARLAAREETGSATVIGTIRAVDSFGAADVISVDCTDGKQMTFAFVKSLEARLDESTRTLSVDGNKLNEVAVYED